MVSLIGEPGIGKSRLLAEFQAVLSSAGIECLQGRCRSYGEIIPYLPLIEIVQQAVGVSSADSPDTVRTCSGNALAAAGLEPSERLPYLLDVLGAANGEPVLAQLSSGAIRARTFETMRLLLLASGQPLVLAIEDVQWIDRTSEEFLSMLAERGAGRPLLLVTTQRPGRRLRWMELSHANQIALGRLRAEDARTVARAHAGAEVGDDVLSAIVERADGNPLFLEELARDIAGVDGHDPSRVPHTVQDVLSARIDRLSESGRRVLRAASVLGRTFAPTLLAELLPETDLAEALDEVARQELLVERPGPTGPMLTFRHALTQEVAYDGLLLTRRRTLHARAGAALERLYEGRTDDALERLAHHFSHSDRPDIAVEYLTRLAAAAAARHANAESAKILEEALRQAAALPADRRELAVVELTLALVSSLYFLGRLERCRLLLLDQSTRVETLGDTSMVARHRFLLAHTLSHLDDWEGAERASLLAISVGERSGHLAEVGKAHYVLTRESVWRARYRIGVEHGARAVHLLEGAAQRWWLAYANSWLATNFAFLADFPSAFESAARASALGEALGDHRIQAYVNGHAGWFEALRGEGRRAIHRAQRALELATDPLGSALATAVLGLGLREVGDHEAAAAALSRAIDDMERFGYRRLVCWYTAGRAESWLGRGELDTAASDARQALAAELQPLEVRRLPRSRTSWMRCPLSRRSRRISRPR